MKCKITHHGAGLRPSLYVRKADRDAFFSTKDKAISIVINDIEGYTTLQPDFFGHVRQIRTVYPTRECLGRNLLVEWIEDNNIKVGEKVELEVIVPFKKFRLGKI